MTKEPKLQPMMVRPTAPVRAYLEAEVEKGNAGSLPEAFNRTVDHVMRDRDDIRRELVTAFGGRDALLIGLLVARTVSAFEKVAGPARSSPESWAKCQGLIAGSLAALAPAPPEGFEVARTAPSDAEISTAVQHALKDGWLFEPAENQSPLLPVDQIRATWASWAKNNHTGAEQAQHAEAFRAYAAMAEKVGRMSKEVKHAKTKVKKSERAK